MPAMKARKRFLLILVLLIIVFAIFVLKNRKSKEIPKKDFFNEKQFRNEAQHVIRTKGNACRMNTCFDLSRCADIGINGLRVHLYPNGQQLSASFAKIHEIIKTSVYFESNPKKACLFLNTLWDSLDRDPLSPQFQRPNPQMTTTPLLLGGVNHVVFNLYSGSWPNYSELDFSYNQNYGKIQDLLQKAIHIKASQSRDSYRKDFDVSLPLFSRSHPTRGPPFNPNENQNIQRIEDKSVVYKTSRSRLLLAFKGKRYIYGIGSETRNALHYLNNGKDVLVLTTCRHGKKWKDLKDDKCEKDNSEYDKHDYTTLMANSTFCLVPRGRRLGSYRFLEALQLGCIPVVLSNAWVLPFEEIIDWKSCVVSADERLLLQIPETLRSFSEHKIATMRHKCLRFYELYFSSVERIVFTSLLIIEQRIQSHVSLKNFHQSLEARWHLDLIPPLTANSSHVTAVIRVQTLDDWNDFQKLIPRLETSAVVRETVVVWSLPLPLPSTPSVRLVKGDHRFCVESETLKTDAVVQLSPQTLLSEEEIEFAFGVWKSFPSRLIGFVARTHFWRENHFEYSSKWTNQYSLVEMESAIYHKRFHDLFKTQNQSNECADLSFQLLVSHVTREGVLKVTQRKRSSSRSDSYGAWNHKRECLSKLSNSYLPLIESKVRFDPLLFRDNVSVKRKKFRKLE